MMKMLSFISSSIETLGWIQGIKVISIAGIREVKGAHHDALTMSVLGPSPLRDVARAVPCLLITLDRDALLSKP